MSANEQRVPGGQPYSGTNRIPNIKQFVESLDRDKKHRDAQIDQQSNQHGRTGPQFAETERKVGKNRRTVHDPVTGRDVEIDDMDDKIMQSVENPTVSHVSMPCP